jgi:hypothetical protein
MIINPKHVESYARAKIQEEVFYSSRKKYDKEEVINKNAEKFLTYLSYYEKDVPKRVRKRLSSFEETRNLAETLVERAEMDAAKKRGRDLLHLTSGIYTLKESKRS